MNEAWDVTLAIASDLHCHEDTFKPQESWLIAGAKRKPTGAHPVQALITLIRRDQLRANALICPGDLANRVSSAGMMQAWDHLRELRTELNCGQLLSTLGNHDVDCKKAHGSDPFTIPRNLHDDFPVTHPSDVANFWANGFYFAEIPEVAEFLVLSTVIGHTDEISAKRGTFDTDRIAQLRAELESRATIARRGDRPIHRVVVMHHHPILHSSVRFGSLDVLEYGDQLLSLLAHHGYRLVIHGHRHDPRVSRIPSGTNEQFVIAAGSFSAILQELSTWTRNLFHIAKLRQEHSCGRLVGEVRTWEFFKGSGWRPSTHVSAALPHVVRFASPRPSSNPEAVKERCAAKAGGLLRQKEIRQEFPELHLLLPSEVMDFKTRAEQLGLKVTFMEDGTIDSVGYPHPLEL